jgi:hypothetical protein
MVTAAPKGELDIRTRNTERRFPRARRYFNRPDNQCITLSANG